MNERDLFIAALQIEDPAGQSAYLDEACGGEAGLRQRVAGLLQAFGQAGSFLQQPAADAATTSDVPPPGPSLPSAAAEGPGTVIGPYKLLQQIGEGGFGAVFMAEQTQPVRRKVALKVLKPGMDTRQVVGRFEAERQALAIMDHPHIAKILDGGATDSGRPYFVMELVKGVPITEFCDQNHLTPRQRLELFVPVCQAVQHAHQKGIIHRDLKPSNVLVTVHDTTPVPKVIDFGVAKALGQELTDKTLFTGFAQMVGTPLYMSPEQAGMSDLDIDTRSDIYSLGVLLYELLTGTTPFDKERFKQAAYDEIRRIIREEDPPKPSTRLSESKDSLPSISAQRHMEPAKLTKLVRGELDWIVMKALEKDRSRRYETANGFAMDVQRYLADEPVLACPPSAGYRFRKFARRNKRTLVTAALLAAMLLVVAGSFGWMARDRAVQRGRNSEAVAALLDQCADALRADRADQAALALGAAERRAADGGAEELAERLARCQADLGLLRKLDAIDTFRWSWTGRAFPKPAAVAARHRAALADYGVTPDEGPVGEAVGRVNGSLVRDRLLTALDRLLYIDPSAGLRALLRSIDPDPYRDAVRDAVAAWDARKGDAWDAKKVADLIDRPEALTQPARFAAILGQVEGVPVDRRRAVLESALRTRPGDLGLLMGLGSSYPTRRLGRSPEGAGERVRWFQAALAARPGHLAVLNNLGGALAEKGNPDEAIASFREVIRLDPKFAFAHFNLAKVLHDKGDLDGAIASYKDAIQVDAEDAVTHSNLGVALADKGNQDGAIASYKEALRLDPNLADAHYNLGNALKRKGDLDGAIASLREAIKADRKVANAHYNLGNALVKKGDPDGAIASFEEAIRLNPESVLAYRNLGFVLRNQGKPDEAIPCFQKAIAVYRKAIQPNPTRLKTHISAHMHIGAILCDDLQDYENAAACFRKAIELDPKEPRAHFNLGNALLGKGNVDGAIASLREAIKLDENYAPAHLSLGNAMCGKGEFDEGIDCYRKAIELDPKLFKAHYNLGVALRNQGKLDDAIASFQKAVEVDPTNFDGHIKLGLMLGDVRHDHDGAAACFRKAIKLNPKSAEARHFLGIALFKKGQLDDAIASLREAIALDAKRAAAHNILGDALRKRGKLDEAIVHVREAIELDPKSAPARHSLGLVLRAQKKLPEAIAAYRKAIALDPKHVRAYIDLGVILCDDLREYEKAADCFRKAIELDPKSDVAYSNLGVALIGQGKPDEAIACFRKAIELAPNLARHHIDLSNALRNQGKLDEAIDVYREAVRVERNKAHAQNRLASALNHRAWTLANDPDPRKRDPGRAVKLATEAVDLAPKSTDCWRALGVAQYRAGKWKESLAALQKSMDLGKEGDNFNGFFLAMAHWQLGNQDEARTWYDRAVAWVEKNQPTNEQLRRFRAEAAQLIGVEKKKD